MTNTEPLILARDLCMTYRRGTEEARALDGVSVHVTAGESVAVVKSVRLR